MRLFSVLASGLLILTMSACAPSRGGTHSDTDRPLFLGDLDKKINEIYSKENEINFDPCDFKSRDRISEVARTLEQKRGEIENLTKSQPTLPNENTMSFGKFIFINDVDIKPGEDKWQSDSYSWNDVISFYDKIKDRPVDKNWATLNRFVRGIVLNDENRIVYLGFGGLSRDAGPKLDAVQEKIQVCLLDTTCINPNLSLEQNSFLSTNRAFGYYIGVLESAQFSQTEKRTTLEKFLKRIKRENSKYAFQVNPVARVEGNTLVIPMDLSALSEAASHFIEILEKAWNVDGEKSVKIEEVNRPISSYLLKVQDIIGGRAFVSAGDGGTINIFNYGRLKTATHEFGHVIGLPDEYYTTWDSSKCGYSDTYNFGNLMSDSSGGAVLPAHWQRIKMNYWNHPSK
ncbi:MAG: hypothetical protein ACXWRU_19310 [Pseudobdellovibrionaceae bacterium]